MTGIFIILAVGAVMGWAGSAHNLWVGELPVFAWCALFIFAMQWLAFIPAFLRQTERFYDLTGSVTYIAAVVLALGLSDNLSFSSILLALCVIVWATRLGSFLFLRILVDGSDSRFDKIKPSPVLFLRTWTLQGLWVLMTGGAALAAISSPESAELSAWVVLGAFLWLMGFIWEVTADNQKRAFRLKQGADKFVTLGLWQLSRHPNYFGEILLWTGVAIMAAPSLHGWQYLTLVSPVFVYLLLTRISGIPLLERKAKKRWGDDPAYQAYLESTPTLWPALGRIKQVQP